MIKHSPDATIGGDVDTEVDFEDARGTITNLLLTQVNSVSEIYSVAGAVRANHFHKTDWHYTYVIEGTVLYFERALGSTEIPDPQTFQSGEMFFTPPNREHAMLFAEESTILTFARNLRDHDSHESDVMRVDFITPEIAKEYV